jgi:hypothetical protein
MSRGTSGAEDGNRNAQQAQDRHDRQEAAKKSDRRAIMKDRRSA